jgi:hypothetical protein
VTRLVLLALLLPSCSGDRSLDIPSLALGVLFGIVMSHALAVMRRVRVEQAGPNVVDMNDPKYRAFAEMKKAAKRDSSPSPMGWSA